MRGEPVANEMRVLVHRAQPPAFKLAVADRLHQLPGDGPVDQANARLERARPVRSATVRAGDEPAVELLGEDIVELALSRDRVGLRQRHEMQMAIRLPKVLDVADDVRVAVVKQLAEGE